jgi:hypothetical protein
VLRCCCSAEVTKAVQARKQDKQRKAQQQLLEPRQGQGVASGAAAEEEDDDDEAALDASLDQVIVTWIRFRLSNLTQLLSDAPMHALAMTRTPSISCFFRG